MLVMSTILALRYRLLEKNKTTEVTKEAMITYESDVLSYFKKKKEGSEKWKAC